MPGSRLINRQGGTRNGCKNLSAVIARLGSPARSDTRLRPRRKGKTEHVDPASLAVMSSKTGDDDITFYWLERAYTDRSPILVHLAGWPSFDPLHSDPRFKDLLRRIGFPQSQRVSAK